MPSFSLRPVDASPSPSPTASSPDHVGPPGGPHHHRTHSRAHSRRPLSPSSLRDLDLTHPQDAHARRYPAPPTGHDLMALFPAQPPDSLAALRAGPTSGYFQRQERAFFAQAGREIVRVRVDVDIDPAELSANAAKRSRGAWAPPPTAVPHRAAPPPPATPVFAPNSHPTLPPHPPPHAHPHSAPHPRPPSVPHHPHPHAAPPSNPRSPPPDDAGSDDTDDSWRRPMPYHERRRAGKHTKRVVVRT
ncbi:hypothetical protein FB45DRAFT_947877 [Roridomyces roridus]|uniref:Uncharacterized protein n=1 Tax=Roridomyces roridus TaxID=1738132 RepID=A0AAD7B136_9AGAR|nr:hypothetical protein FB45DRAFT_947877 [Roridomyces roridus]